MTITAEKKQSITISELYPIYDAKASFYGKARVIVCGNKKTLVSYDTEVAEIENDNPVVFGCYSSTTLRHIKEFLRQNGFRADTKSQIEKDYIK